MIQISLQENDELSNEVNDIEGESIDANDHTKLH